MLTRASAAEAGEAKRQHYGMTLGVLIVAALSYALSQTLVSPALPAIQRALDTSTTAVTFVLTAFLLTASVSTPVVGRLGDMFGKKRLLVITLAIFGVGSLVAALAPSIELLVAGRAIQGVGGAVFPLSFGIIRDEFPREKVAGGIGLISATFGIGGGAGVVLSGVIVDHLAYEWIFWLGLFVVVVAILATHLFVPESPVTVPAKIDWGGAVLLSGGLVALLVALSEGNTWGWFSARILGLFGAAAIFLAAWVGFEWRHPQPLVDMHMMRRRAVLTTNATGMLVGFGMFSSFILIPQFVQMPARAGYGFAATVTESGLFLLPMTGVMLVAGPLAGWLGGRLGSRVPLMIGTATAAAGFAFLAVEHADPWSIYIATGMFGLGIGFSFAAMANLIVEAVDPTQTGVATGMNTIMRTIGGSVGGQVAASIVAGHVAASGLPEESGFTTAFLLSAAGMGAAALVAVAVPGRRYLARRAQAQPTEPTLFGRVLGADEFPLAAAMVTVTDPDGAQVARARTDADGGYAVLIASAGRYVVLAADEDHHPNAATATVNGQPTELDVVLAGVRWVHGVVRTTHGVPVAQAVVTVITAGGATATRTRTDEEGRYRVGGLPAGAGVIVAFASGVEPAASDLDIPAVGALGCDLTLSVSADPTRAGAPDPTGPRSGSAPAGPADAAVPTAGPRAVASGTKAPDAVEVPGAATERR